MKAHNQKAVSETAGGPPRAPERRTDSGWLKVTVRPSEPSTADGPNTAPKTPVPERRGQADRTTLSALLQAPARASEVPLEHIPALVAELASEQAALSAIQGLLTARLLVTPVERVSDEGRDRLLAAEEVARMLGVTKRWVQRRAPRLPFSRRISVRSVRYSEAGLKRWMANRQMSKR
jgi:predicted DNA-binding transcriptional regulator AlpA